MFSLTSCVQYNLSIQIVYLGRLTRENCRLVILYIFIPVSENYLFIKNYICLKWENGVMFWLTEITVVETLHFQRVFLQQMTQTWYSQDFGAPYWRGGRKKQLPSGKPKHKKDLVLSQISQTIKCFFITWQISWYSRKIHLTKPSEIYTNPIQIKIPDSNLDVKNL